MNNLHYVFHTEYYGIESFGKENKYKAHNETLKNFELVKSPKLNSLHTHTFLGKTLYPGLLLGLGYPHEINHETKTEKSEAIKLGFSFDFVTGMPYIPGSTVKGTLRNAFRNYQELIKEKMIQNIELEKLEKAIFGDWVDQEEITAPSLKKRDIFFDAVIVTPNTKGHILGEEYITPHKSTKENIPDIFAEPTPIKLLKVLAGVTFEFRFKLKDSFIDELKISADDKIELFKELISLLGIGAKTKVGFGGIEILETIPDKEGKCKDCGEKVGVNSKTGEYYPRCNFCKSKFEKKQKIPKFNF